MNRRDAFKRTDCVNNLPPLALIPINRRTTNASPPPSPSGLWWFLDQVTPEERRAVNDAATGAHAVALIQTLYNRYPRLATEALKH